MAALQLITSKIKQDIPMSAVLNLYDSVPMRLENLKDMDKSILDDEAIISLCQSLTDDFAGEGRILLRPSGTEPLIRVMVEATDKDKLDAAMAELISALTQANQALKSA